LLSLAAVAAVATARVLLFLVHVPFLLLVILSV